MGDFEQFYELKSKVGLFLFVLALVSRGQYFKIETHIFCRIVVALLVLVIY